MSDPRPSVFALGGLGAAAALFVWMISTGIARYNECGELQGDPKYENRKIYSIKWEVTIKVLHL